MRSTQPETKLTLPETAGERTDDSAVALAEMIERMTAGLNACEAMGDLELARHTGRKLLAVVSCSADVVLRDGGTALQAAPDKFGAFFDKAAAGYVQAIEGLHKRAVLAEPVDTDAFAPGRPRAGDLRENATSPWGLAAQRWRAGRSGPAERE